MWGSHWSQETSTIHPSIQNQPSCPDKGDRTTLCTEDHLHLWNTQKTVFFPDIPITVPVMPKPERIAADCQRYTHCSAGVQRSRPELSALLALSSHTAQATQLHPRTPCCYPALPSRFWQSPNVECFGFKPSTFAWWHGKLFTRLVFTDWTYWAVCISHPKTGFLVQFHLPTQYFSWIDTRTTHTI